MIYEDCYKGCGGEDCVCCEIFHEHQMEQRTEQDYGFTFYLYEDEDEEE